MIISFLSISLISCSFFLFTFTYTYIGVNRIITCSPRSIFESSIPLTTSNIEETIHFDKEALKKTYDNYLKREVTKYVKEYEVNYYFYNKESGGVCEVDDCLGVEISFKCNVLYFSHYERVMYYEIVEGKMHG